MAISPVQTLEVPDVCHRWLENRGTVYELLIDFMGNSPSLSMIAEWSRGSGIGKAAEGTEGGADLVNYLCGRSPEELVKICEYEGAEYRRLLERNKQRPLSESQYTKSGCVRDVAECYETVGVAFNKLHGEADDHLAIELEFMTVLHDRMLNNCYGEDGLLKLMAAQEQFLEEHLLAWVPSLCEDMKTSTDSPLYRALFRLLEEFLMQDLRMLKVWRQSREAELVH
ncbi:MULTISPECIES: TorD/DmsD family molecular chaperone [Paenibacillus]|uniref:TorD/DmsD family molecular chaperone n=1 Tax=Paenibacillus TaxID=44249 RepID=UPI0011A28586|nr:molecular chaperone TorD family protein [Paenibacillus sp. IHBB 10380]